MPPWFADPRCRALLERSIADADGNRTRSRRGRSWRPRWKSARCSAAARMDRRMEHSATRRRLSRCRSRSRFPAQGDVEYTYEIVPTGFTEGKWVQMSEIRPSSRENVHHAVVYIRPPDSQWLRHAPIGKPFTASDLTSEQDRRDAHCDRRRHPARLRAGKLAGQLARRHGEVRSRRFRSGVPDALHDARARCERPDEHRNRLRQAAAEAARAHTAADQRSLRHSAGRRRLSRGSLTARCRTTRCCSASSRTCTCAAKRFEYNMFFVTDGQHGTAAARELRFLLADELSAGEAAAAEGGNRAAGGGVVRQLARTIRTIPIRTRPFTGAIRRTMK